MRATGNIAGFDPRFDFLISFCFFKHFKHYTHTYFFIRPLKGNDVNKLMLSHFTIKNVLSDSQIDYLDRMESKCGNWKAKNYKEGFIDKNYLNEKKLFYLKLLLLAA